MFEWEYIYIDYDQRSNKSGRVDNTLPYPERFVQAAQKAFEPRSLFIHYPDGSLNIIEVDPLMIEREILQVLNSFGREGWEAFYCSREENGSRIQWALKRLVE